MRTWISRPCGAIVVALGASFAVAGCGDASQDTGATFSNPTTGGGGGMGGVGGNGGAGATTQSGGGGAATTSTATDPTTTTTTTEKPEPYCGDGEQGPDEACDDGNENPFDGCKPDCTVVPPIEAPPLEWTYIEVPGTECMNGETAGFGISLNPDSNNVMIYLEGGGACFNDLCDVLSFNIPFIPPPDGIFNRNNPGNPVKDWSMIYVPYCTGDIHGGDKETEVAGSIQKFKGYANIGKYLEQWVPTFANADKVLLTGISAGGFGAGLNAARVADAFGPGHQMIVIDDSGPPLSNIVIPPCLQQTFRDVWGLDSTVLAECGADCADPNDFATGALAHVMEKYPDMRFGLFSNTADTVIRSFMGFGWGGGVWNDCDGLPDSVPADVYEVGLLSIRFKYADRASTYFIGQDEIFYNFGQGHTALRSPSFWTMVIDGVQLSDWVGAVIDGEIQHVGL